MKNIQYYEHTCLCGCDDKIEIKSHHKYYGIPKYINGHNETDGGFKHGETDMRLYSIWQEMKYRCLNTNHKAYKDYGGRGITICPEWAESYIVFRNWALSNGYQENLQINRIENEGNYEPSNCNFIIGKENTRNRRGQKIKNMGQANEIRYLHKTGNHTLKQLAGMYNTSITNISNIINNKRWV